MKIGVRNMKIEIERVDLEDIVHMLEEYNRVHFFYSVLSQIDRLKYILKKNTDKY